MKIIQEHLCKLLQTIPTSKMLQFPLCLDALFVCLDALFGHLSKAQIKQVQDVSQKVTLHRPYSITKATDGLFINIMEIAPDSLVR